MFLQLIYFKGHILDRKLIKHHGQLLYSQVTTDALSELDTKARLFYTLIQTKGKRGGNDS